jgi:hypothetical protein
MNTANTMPSPATVTNPPFCDSSDGAPAVVALTLPPVDVDVDVNIDDEEFVLLVAEALIALPVDETFSLVDTFPLAVEFETLPVALAMDVGLVVASVFDSFVLEELCVCRQLGLSFWYLTVILTSV